MSGYAEPDRWVELWDAERDEENEHLRASEEARIDRLREKGWPHVRLTGPVFLCTPCECGGQCERCAA